MLPRLASLSLAAVISCGLATLPAFAADAKTKANAIKPTAKRSGKTARKPVVVEAPVPEAQPEQVKAAELVYYGAYDCEFSQTLNIVQSSKHPAYVDVKAGKKDWLMKPVLSSTGAIRLEDVRGETLMVQISAKSMLLNVKTAQRIVDDCTSPKQRELVAEARAAKAAADAAPAKLLTEASASV
ncbi:MAG: hypothetical protein ABI281_11075, partial [Caldimonas sp.]